MQASIVDLRYKTNAVLSAIDNNESVDILYHGVKKATLVPILNNNQSTVKKHAFFGMGNQATDALEELGKLRSNRYAL